MKSIELLGICSVCDKIRIDNEKNLWLSRNQDSELYDRLVKEKRLTHGYCPKHFEEAMKEVEEYKKLRN